MHLLMVIKCSPFWCTILSNLDIQDLTTLFFSECLCSSEPQVKQKGLQITNNLHFFIAAGCQSALAISKLQCESIKMSVFFVQMTVLLHDNYKTHLTTQQRQCLIDGSRNILVELCLCFRHNGLTYFRWFVSLFCFVLQYLIPGSKKQHTSTIFFLCPPDETGSMTV